jgi:hypothetical protein
LCWLFVFEEIEENEKKRLDKSFKNRKKKEHGIFVEAHYI